MKNEIPHADKQISALEQLEQRIIASALSLTNQDREFPADIKAIIAAPKEIFCDFVCANIADAIGRAATNGKPPKLETVLNLLDATHRQRAIELSGAGDGFSLVEADAKDLLNHGDQRAKAAHGKIERVGLFLTGSNPAKRHPKNLVSFLV